VLARSAGRHMPADVPVMLLAGAESPARTGVCSPRFAIAQRTRVRLNMKERPCCGIRRLAYGLAGSAYCQLKRL